LAGSGQWCGGRFLHKECNARAISWIQKHMQPTANIRAVGDDGWLDVVIVMVTRCSESEHSWVVAIQIRSDPVHGRLLCRSTDSPRPHTSFAVIIVWSPSDEVLRRARGPTAGLLEADMGVVSVRDTPACIPIPPRACVWPLRYVTLLWSTKGMVSHEMECAAAILRILLARGV
jgi:hypothetical protein